MEKLPKVDRHPDAIAWDEWFAKRPMIADVPSLGTTDRANEYLKNRLEMAWQAGIEYGRRTPDIR